MLASENFCLYLAPRQNMVSPVRKQERGECSRGWVTLLAGCPRAVPRASLIMAPFPKPLNDPIDPIASGLLELSHLELWVQRERKF